MSVCYAVREDVLTRSQVRSRPQTKETETESGVAVAYSDAGSRGVTAGGDRRHAAAVHTVLSAVDGARADRGDEHLYVDTSSSRVALLTPCSRQTATHLRRERIGQNGHRETHRADAGMQSQVAPGNPLRRLRAVSVTRIAIERQAVDRGMDGGCKEPAALFLDTG